MRQSNKLNKNNIENLMSLTSLQQGMLFHYISDEESNMYHEQLSLTFRGDMKLELLQKAWNIVIQNNEMLRTIFRWTGIKKPVQVVLKQHEIPIKYLDFTNEEDKEDLIKEVKLNDLNNRIDITRETLRIYLCKLDESNHEMIISNHHILYDGWSNGIILKEVIEAYNCLYEGKEPKKLNKTRFSQFIKYLNTINKEDEKKYWSNYLDGLENKDNYFSCKEAGVHKEISYKIDSLKANKIKEFSKRNEVLLSSILYGAWGVLLQKFNNSNEVLFGTTVSGRTENISSIDKMVGLFINTIPLRVKSDKKTTLMGLIKSLDANLNARKDFENTALTDIKKYCGLKVNEEIFSSIVTIENYPLDFRANKEYVLSIEGFSIVEQTNYNMALEILTFDGIEFKFNFNSLLIDESIVKKFGIYLERIIENLLNIPNTYIENIDLLSEEERDQILYEFNDTKTDYPKDKTIQELFEEQVEKTPNNIAVVLGDKELTYKEINERANSLAKALREKGVGPDVIVGIMIDRSIEMIVGILAILKAGGAYMPINPDYPQERIKYMLDDSNANIVLTQSQHVDRIRFNGIIIDLDNKELYEGSKENLENIDKSSDLAYVIYTSGTTGNPKGVMIEHRNLVRLMFNDKMQFDFNEKDVWTMFHSFCFDFSVWEMYGALLYGGKLIIVPKLTAQDSREFLKLIEKERVTVLNQTPTSFYRLSEEALKESYNNLILRYVIFGGEALKPSMLSDWKRKYNKTKLINMYGITETTVHVTFKEITDIDIQKSISNVGVPIPTLAVYIMDKNMNLLPILAPGELCVGGDGVGRGYINNKGLTEEKFIENPYNPQERLYRSGDLARWLPDGNIEYLGRIDHQVKIRGFRIEIGEIESKLKSSELIKEAIVVDKEDKQGSKYLCAYIVSEKEMLVSELREYLSKQLPGYMIPSYFVNIEELPLTANGKLDKKALPDPGENIKTGVEYVAPSSNEERKLVKIWSDILSVEEDKIGIKDSFWDMGGDSIRAISLVSTINKEFNANIKLTNLYMNPTIKGLCQDLKVNNTESLHNEISKAREELDMLKQNIIANEEFKEKLPSDIEDFYPMSDIQLGMVYHGLKDSDKAIYHDQFQYQLKIKNFNLNIFKKAMALLVSKHTMLRTGFNIEDFDIPMQIIYKNVKLDIEEIEISALSNIEKTKYINKHLEEDRKNSFNISKNLWRQRIFNLDDEHICLVFIFHHAILDGWSVASLVTELINTYFMLTTDEKFIPVGLKNSYKEYIIDQIIIKNDNGVVNYWKEELRDYKRLNLPVNTLTKNREHLKFNSASCQLNKEFLDELKVTAKKYNVTIRTLCFAAYSYIFNMFSYENDIVLGLVENNRPLCEDGEKILGCFLNTVPVRMHFNDIKTWEQIIKYVEQKVIDLKLYGRLPLLKIIDAIGEKAHDGNPIFDTLFNYVDFHVYNDVINKDVAHIKDRILVDGYEATNTLIDFTVNKTFDQLTISVKCSEDIFTKSQIDKYIKYFINILNMFIHNPDGAVNKFDILEPEESKRILYEFNDTKVDYPKDKTIQELFEEQVEKTPDNIAVVFEDEKLTYRELNERSNSLARVLRDKGVKADSIVGIMVERSLEMIIGIMGILKAGGAYLPIDPSYPKERIEYMLKDSGCRVLLSKDDLLEAIEFDGEMIDLFNKIFYMNDSTNLTKINNSINLAYIIYTSGTTGNPKGAMIEHRSLVNRLNWMQRKYPISEKDTILQKTTYTFDVSVWEILWWSLAGAKVCMLTPYGEKDPMKVIEMIEKYKVTTMHFVPSMLDVFLYCVEENRNSINLSSLRQVFSSGEVLNFKQVSKFYKEFETGKKLINLYGPTEATIDVSYFDCCNDNKKIIPIGKPIDNTELYILKNTELVPIGVAGELYIAGHGLARGYLNRPELTAEKFIDNPFELGTKMYKTGDLARWLPDGNIEFLGRIDNQVKIRGFRIELGEIENRLVENENIKEATVLVKENKDGEKYICAYVVSENSLEELDLRNYLRETLPEYMIPAYFVKLEKMPLTTNGKIDRGVLPEPSLNATLTEYEAPRNEIEEILASIWSEVLGIEKVGINDNFFELGGHSLKATVLISKIHKELNKEVPLKELFRFPTIKELSKYIESTEENPYSMIEKAEVKEYYEASSAQKRMYLLQQFNKDSTAYNMPAIFKLEGEVNKEKLEAVFKKLVERHENLRTCFKTIDGEIVQIIKTDNEFKLTYINTNSSIENILSDFIKPFDLEKDSMLRAELVEVGEINYLLIDMHHIISDGISKNIIEREFADLYNDKDLEPLKLQYKDFSEWQNNFLKSKEMKKQEEYWLNVFSDEIPVLNMPIDYKRPVMQSFEGDSVGSEVDEEIVLGLKKLTKETGTTMHMVLLSAFNIILSKYTGQEDIIVGTPVAGRPHADLENIMGLFVNTLALRNKPEGNKKYIDFLKEVKEDSLKAYENQSYQLETLIDKLEVKRDMSRNPLFDVMFNIASTLNNEKIDLDGLFLKPYDNSNRTSKFDMTLNAIENDEKINLSIQYCTKLFKEETIKRFINHYLNILKVIIENREIELKEMDILSEEERNQILYEFNDTKADYPKDKTIQELFEEQVEKTPDNIAIVFEDKKLTYRELNEKSNSLARLLREKGVRPNSIVGIMVERSPEMIIGIMGILKSGGAYLPIDPMLPKSRIEYMLNDSSSNILLSEKRLIEGIDYCGELVDIYVEKSYIKAYENLDLINKSTDLSYIIYTSGTTGEPKGVMIEHKSVCNLVFGLIKKVYSIYKDELKVGFISPYYFDASVKQIFTTLLNGHSLYISDENTRKDGAKLLEFYRKNQIEISDGTPLHINIVNNFLFGKTKEALKLKHFIIGGESLQINTVKELLKNIPNIRISNVYGPTECCVDSSIVLIDKKNIDCMDRILIGKPMPNYRIYILDQNNKETPIGVNGELCISGDGLSRGYLNRLELTGEKFIDNPFDPGTKMYKTGDLARWLPDGNIEFLGRNDSQVKIRGFRIELGEIENAILEHRMIKDVVVAELVNDDIGNYLCAYVVINDKFEEETLRAYLMEKLPSYMIPSYFIEITEIPITPNGKVSKNMLPDPITFLEKNTDIEEPRNIIEEHLVNIWRKVLGVQSIGIDSNFYNLGGDSIKAIQISSKLLKHGYVLEIKDIFKYPKIKQLSEKVRISKTMLSQKMVEGETELTPIQKRFFDNFALNLNHLNHFNQSVMLYKREGFDQEIVKKVFDKIFEHHDALRMIYKINQSEIKQINRGVGNRLYRFNEYNYKGQKNTIKNIENECEKMQKSINITKGALINIGLFKTDEGDHLAIIIHHLIIDGVSWRILFEDFSYGYNQLEKREEIILQEKTTSYMEWAKSIKEYSKNKKILNEIEFWKKQEESEVGYLQNQYKTRDYCNNLRDVLSLQCSEQETEDILKNVNRAYNTEINDILLAALTKTLKVYINHNNILVNLEGHGREEIIEGLNITRTIGWFTIVYPVVFSFNEKSDISSEIKLVKEKLRQVPNKGIGYGILKYLTEKESLNGLEFKLKPQVLFNYLGQFDEDVKKGIFEMSNIKAGNNIHEENKSNYLIDINGIIINKKLVITFDFDARKFDTESMNNLIKAYKSNLLAIIEHCLNKKETGVTPSDLGNYSVTMDELDEFLEELDDKIELD
ncbi:amino acid adenylation domain-containing protein/non-ribosomal peptide synthase protein (TIGR01720 family) [Clostridium beijerinckii]|uniref:non-ribosomal peptide synthetase n=1 Tax=Clostridium beijerinckii TaxID=1520 RepID=UPI001570CA7C|nr:non-ribosomal peptide synthetase [Clostridium beijerinckii]NRT44807.1 amino acid adenylation domain-containing protein/non-ribosomal peptide synthase protein (TIGR01720 family) [Clostridium beijerinckii]